MTQPSPSPHSPPPFTDPRCWLVPFLALLAAVALAESGLNRWLFLFINGWSAHTGDGVWAGLTVLGDTTVALALALPFVGRRPDIVWSLMLAALLATLWVHGLKQPLGVMRPPAVLDPGSFHVIGKLLRTGSFPSGHTTTIFTLAGVLALHFPGRGHTASFAVLALLVGLSRCVVGVHWPLDVLGGAFGGWLAAVGGTLLAQRWPAGLKTTPQALFALLLAGSALALVKGARTGYDVGVWQQILGLLCLLPFAFWLLLAVRGRVIPAPSSSHTSTET